MDGCSSEGSSCLCGCSTKLVMPHVDRLLQLVCMFVCPCSYEARAHGVKRNMRGDDARKACPDIQLVQASCRPCNMLYLTQFCTLRGKPTRPAPMSSWVDVGARAAFLLLSFHRLPTTHSKALTRPALLAAPLTARPGAHCPRQG